MKSEYSWLYAWYGVGYTSCNEHVRFKYLATWDLGPDSLIWRCTARQLLLVQHKLCWSTKGRSCVHYVVSVDDDLVCQDYWTNISYDYIYIYIYIWFSISLLWNINVVDTTRWWWWCIYILFLWPWICMTLECFVVYSVFLFFVIYFSFSWKLCLSPWSNYYSICNAPSIF
jgi:hypothetical protein